MPATTGTVTVTATSAGLNKMTFAETSVAAVPTAIAVSGGNNQAATAGTQLATALSVLVTDQFGNPLPGASVNFSDNGAGGIFAYSTPVLAGSNGIATELYTLPSTAGAVVIDATVNGLSNPAAFSETGQ